MATHPQYIVTLKVLPDDSTDGDGYRRLRAFLKAAARSWRLQCTRIEPAKDISTEGDTDAVEAS